MKKAYCFLMLTAALLVFTLISTQGCGELDSEASDRNESHHRISPLTIAHGAGSGGGMWYIAAEGLAQFLREQYPGSRISVVTGSSDGNLARLQRGEVQLAISATDSAAAAVKGEEVYSRPIPMEDIKVIARLYQARLHFVFASRLKINSLEQIKAERIPVNISVGGRGSGMERGARRMLGEYGITYEDIERWGGRVVFVGHAESARMMGDGQINAMIGLSAVPMSILNELATKRDFTIMPVSEKVAEKMVDKFNYTVAFIPAGSYDGVSEDTLTVGVANGIFAPGSMSDDTAYQVTAALLDEIERLRGLHSQLNDITPGFMNQPMIYNVHPGALRAYKERD